MPKKASTQSKKTDKIEVSDDELSDNDSVMDSDSDTDTEIKVQSTKSTKSTKATKKETKTSTKSDDEKDTEDELSKVDEYFQELHNKFESMSEHITSLKTMSDTFTASFKSFKTLEKDLKKMFKQVQLEVGKEHKKLSKGKKGKAGTRKKGGCVTKQTPVPDKIIKYLKLDSDAHFTRPEITAKLYEEFKKRTLSIGNRKNKMDRDTAKLFSGDKGDEFHIHDFQRMLKKIYDADPKTSKVKKSTDSDGDEETL